MTEERHLPRIDPFEIGFASKRSGSEALTSFSEIITQSLESLIAKARSIRRDLPNSHTGCEKISLISPRLGDWVAMIGNEGRIIIEGTNETYYGSGPTPEASLNDLIHILESVRKSIA